MYYVIDKATRRVVFASDSKEDLLIDELSFLVEGPVADMAGKTIDYKWNSLLSLIEKAPTTKAPTILKGPMDIPIPATISSGISDEASFFKDTGHVILK